MGSLYILDISPLSDLGLVKIFSQSVGCLIDSVLCLTEDLQFYEVPFVDKEQLLSVGYLFPPLGLTDETGT